MIYSIRKKLLFGFIITSIMIGSLTLFYYQTTREFIKASYKAQYTLEYLLALEEISSILKDAETGQRGFIITNRESYLQPFKEAISILKNKIAAGRKRTPVNSLHKFSLLTSKIDQKINELQSTIALTKSGDNNNNALKIINHDVGKNLMDEIRSLISELQDQGLKNRKKLNENLERSTGRSVFIVSLAGISTFFFLLFGFTTVTSEVKKRYISEMKLDQANQAYIESNKALLETKQKLQKINDELSLANEEIISTNEELNSNNEELHVINEQMDKYSKELEDRNSQLKRLNKELTKYSLELNDIYNNAPCAYYSVDSNGCYIKVNDKELEWIGYTREEMIGKMKFSDLLAEKSKERFSITFQLFKREGRVDDLEFDLVRKDGSVMSILLSATAIYDQYNNFQMSRSTFTDHTPFKKVRDKLEEKTKDLESFSYSTSHDLRAPLRAISGFTRILKNEYGDRLDDEGKRLLKIVSENANRMGQLIDNLLEFSRLGSKALSKTKFDMEKLIHTVLQNAISNGLSPIEVKIGPMPEVCADIQLMKQVLDNLISNAIKYSAKTEHPQVEITFKENEKEFEFSVKDNGVGFDMKYANNLFGVFQRLHTPYEFEGTGVGLAIVRKIVMSHGGKVSAYSEINKGATFFFTLPKEGALKGLVENR